MLLLKKFIFVLPTTFQFKDIEQLIFVVKILAMYDKIVAAKERGSIASYRKPLWTHAHRNLCIKWFIEMIHTIREKMDQIWNYRREFRLILFVSGNYIDFVMLITLALLIDISI